ncbi:MAG TPA: Maf family protein [Candidatus Baltobacteraceae bacterium]|nr:Maf family protein [Candidatus Baltobacteraceae bacterium]
MSKRCPLTRIVLASASPRRLELLRSLGLQVEVVPSGYHEPSSPGLTPAELGCLHAREKLAATIAKLGRPGADAVVAADTVVDVDGVALGKPVDSPDAVRMLSLLSGREHVVHTAFALALPGHRQWIEELSSTRVRFFALEADEIAEYVATGEPFDKAGGYGIQGRAAALVETIQGDFYTVMGFALGRFVRSLRRSGFSLPAAKQTPTA